MYIMPVFIFDMNKYTIRDCIHLYAPAIRCAIEDCGSGWLFVFWIFGEEESNHVTAFYFRDKQQYFLDTSTLISTQHDRDGNDLWSFFREHHVWLSPRESPESWMVDDALVRSGLHRTQNIQAFFRSTDKEDLCDLAGCCTTVVILLVSLCLRFGCTNPQTMVDALRQVMKHARRDPTMNGFLFKLRRWQEQMASPHKQTHRELLYWLKIKVPDGACLPSESGRET
jgi:hypothetical protein